jgi:hypothetical protein
MDSNGLPACVLNRRYRRQQPPLIFILTVVVYYPPFLGVKKVQQAVAVNKTAGIVFNPLIKKKN